MEAAVRHHGKTVLKSHQLHSFTTCMVWVHDNVIAKLPHNILSSTVLVKICCCHSDKLDIQNYRARQNTFQLRANSC